MIGDINDGSEYKEHLDLGKDVEYFVADTAKQTIIDYSKSGVIDKYRKDPDDLKAIARRNRNVPSLSKQIKNWIFKKEYSDYTNDKDELAMGGIASLIK